MKNKLNILWTNADEKTSKLMVLMYASNAIPKGWWDEVNVIIWGATAKLVAENEEIQIAIKVAEQAGAKFYACQACARELGVDEKLRKLGIEVKFMGQPLTDILKTDGKLLTI